ncbi:histidine phosphatase family protein [Herbaspirillum sp.]|uniref:histidine phosphatase family protein n=1 Tax=Herbaspirillum sp. TaxID=1890675 RepID=UPI001B03F953|nr:histidine phosphatase family protein [Herbaspirillum sp.]MBO9535921.1 histidine phosphatase family protein [Herbaspirillum sp.]
MRLHLVRHPATILGQAYCYGSSDVAVAPAELASCCARVSPSLPQGVPIVSSPLQRCAGLAKVLAQTLDSEEPTFESGLQEMDFGSWELRAWDDIAWNEVEAWNSDLLHYAPGGGETLVTVAQRVWAVFDSLRRGGDEQAIVICHGGSIRMLRACAAWHAGRDAGALPDAGAMEAIALQAAADRCEIGFGEVVTLEADALPGKPG